MGGGALGENLKTLKLRPFLLSWRSDVKKFFDHVDHEILIDLIEKGVSSQKAIWLLKKIITCHFLFYQ